MYKDFFGIGESPFSIVPSARFLYLSERHREALTHMLASLSGGGGFGLLTGEVGTGKTTVLRALVARLPQETQVAIILNPALSAHDLLATICDELGVGYPDDASYKVLTDRIYQHLLSNHSEGKQTLLLVDEAQHLMPDVLEQLRSVDQPGNRQPQTVESGAGRSARAATAAATGAVAPAGAADHLSLPPVAADGGRSG